MANQRLTAGAFAGSLLLATSCSPLHVREELETMWDRGTGKMIQAARGRGDKMLKTSAETIRDEGCQDRPLPYFRLVASEIHPSNVRDGESFHHRFIYALCLQPNGRNLTGRLTKSIFYDGRPIHTEVQSGYRLRPGTWADDDEIEVPVDAPIGSYEISITVFIGKRKYDLRSDFKVDNHSGSAW